MKPCTLVPKTCYIAVSRKSNKIKKIHKKPLLNTQFVYKKLAGAKFEKKFDVEVSSLKRSYTLKSEEAPSLAKNFFL